MSLTHVKSSRVPLAVLLLVYAVSLLNLTYPSAFAQGFQNTLVNNPPTGSSFPWNTQSETTIAVNGNTVVVAYNDFTYREPSLTGSRIGVSRSVDGGLTFSPAGSLPTSDNGHVAGDDPILYWWKGSGGAQCLYLLTLGENADSPLLLFKSTDWGVTWQQHPKELSEYFRRDYHDEAFDKPSLAVDSGGQNVYVSCIRTRSETDLGGRTLAWQEIVLWKSLDSGQTFGGNDTNAYILASRSSYTSRPQYPISPWVIAEGSGGGTTAQVFWFDKDDSGAQSIQMRKVYGNIFFDPALNSASRQVTSLSGLDFNLGFRSAKYPIAQANPANGNHLAVAFADVSASDKGDVYYCQSTDGGVTWSAKVKVNTDSTTTAQFNPVVSFNSTGTRLFVGYYSRENDPADYLIDTYGRFASVNPSTLALTWKSRFRITSGNFSPMPNPGTQYMGDYDMAVGDADYIYYSWGDNRDTAQGPNVRMARLAPADTFSIADLGALGGNYYSTGLGLNNKASMADTEVVGYTQVAAIINSNYALHGFRWQYNQMFDLSSSFGNSANSYAMAISDSSIAVGYTDYYGYYYPNLWDGWGLHNMATLSGGYGYTYAKAVSNAGLGYIVGTSRNSLSANRAVYWSPADYNSTVTDLLSLGGQPTSSSFANGINNGNRAVGKSQNGSGVYRAFRTRVPDGTSPVMPITPADDLGTLSGGSADNSEALAINNQDWVVGWSKTSIGTTNAFLCGPTGTMGSNLGTLGGNWSTAKAINDRLVVVGQAKKSDGSYAAFVYKTGWAVPVELTTAVQASGWTLVSADGINSFGQITGWGYHNGVPRAYLLNPQ